MSEILHPDLVAAGIAFLDDEKTRRLANAISELAKQHLAGVEEAERYIDLVTDFLLREVGIDELRSQHRRYKEALRDALLFARRQ